MSGVYRPGDHGATARLHCGVAGRIELPGIFVCARADAAADAEAALREAHGKLRFRFSPRLAVEHPATGRIKKRWRRPSVEYFS